MIKILFKYKWYIISILLFIISIPIFLNWFINLEVQYKVASENDWIGFHASYLGGILGGIISGSLTLGGVYITIKKQEEKEYKKELTVRFLYSKKINSELVLPLIIQSPLEYYFDNGSGEEYKIEVERYLEDCLKNKDQHMEYASFIGVEYFRNFNRYVNKCETLMILLNNARLAAMVIDSNEKSSKTFVEIKRLVEELNRLHNRIEIEIERIINK